MIKGYALGLLTAGLLAACSATPPPEEPPRPPPMPQSSGGECGAAQVQAYRGEPYSATLEQTIAAQSDAGRVRVIRPGQAYTMDYRHDRLNIHLDASGRITELNCG
ncbi:Peptidase inhibitor I78 family protein [Modicisalibacter muralis]|uniref:Peptidase inhibitor I78 family protein n=1 Tax=Modicisalibacter muralis TaxID=119000 RepID=A0A1G9JYT1_9GAMM|nr:I78 family peptidase inhibitor [Halomonas muralis]SDL42678.1 Peptidase inhibitor I78 family protein [Halomonas muralis]